MEQDDGFGVLYWGVAEVVDVTVGAQAADEGGTGRRLHGVSLGSNRDFAVVTDADRGSLASDKGHQGQAGTGRRTERFSARACSRAAWGVIPSSR